ncbi:PAS domain S-box-containing protein [Oxalobacteraceae bacterium GrIS 2.11]
MLPAPIPDDEAARVASLLRMAILSTPNEEIFDKIARITKIVMAVPITLVSLIDSERQWFKACFGLPVQETPRDISFCGHAIMHDSLFIIPDATKDARFADNPLVTGEPHIVFYAGRPLKSPDGHRVGTLCIIDHKPRQLSLDEQALLNDLGSWVEQTFLVRMLATHDVRWQMLFENMTVGFASHEIIQDDRGKVIDYRFIEMNPAYEQITGISASEAIGRTVLDLLPGTDTSWIEVFGQVALTGKPLDYENFSDELGRWYNVRAYRPRDRQFALMVTDITQSKQTEEKLGALTLKLKEKIAELELSEEKLQGLNEKLEYRVKERTHEYEATNISLKSTIERLENTQNELVMAEKLASLGAMVAGISHELNTPIGNVVTLISLLEANFQELLTQIREPNPRRKVLEELMLGGKEMTTLSARNIYQAAELVQSFKRVAVDQTSEQRRKFNLKAVLDDVVNTVIATSKRNKNFNIESRIPADIECDSYPGPLSQVVTNLIQNALIHGFANADSGLITITANTIGDRIRIVVEDDGIGMAPEVLSHIFDPFFTTKLGQGGSGLGLSISYRIATTVLTGKISASSKPGQGARFDMTVPRIAPL